MNSVLALVLLSHNFTQECVRNTLVKNHHDTAENAENMSDLVGKHFNHNATKW